MRFINLHLYFFSLLSTYTLAQFQFLHPDGNLDDNSQTFTVGSSQTLKWKGGWFGQGDKQVFADLFLTDWDANQETLIKLVKKNISLAQDGSYTWKVDVSVNEAKSLKRFVLRFVKAINPPSYSEGVKTGMSPSRGFYLVSPATSLSAKALITRTASIASTSIPVATPGASPSTAQPPSSESNTPIGAIVGSVIGGLGLIALLIISFLLWKLVKRRKAKAMIEPGPEGGSDMLAMDGDTAASTSYHKPQDPPVPLYEDNPRVQELPNNEVRYEADTGSPRISGK